MEPNGMIGYPGGKWRFYEKMSEYFPTDMTTFVDAFFGGGSTTLNIVRDERFRNLKRIIVGDLNPDMIYFWKAVKENPNQFATDVKNIWKEHNTKIYEFKKYNKSFNDCIELRTNAVKQVCTEEEIKSVELYNKQGNFHEKNLKIIFDACDKVFENDEYTKKMLRDYEDTIQEAREFWRWLTTVDINTLTDIEKGARTYLVNKISFSSTGDAGYLSKKHYEQMIDTVETIPGLYDTSAALQKVEIYNQPFQESMKMAESDPNVFVFLDPPYCRQEESGLYGRKGAMHKGFDHDAFAQFCKEYKGKWFITYDDSMKIRSLFNEKGIIVQEFRLDGGYTMALKETESADALDGEELFIMNYGADKEDEDDDFFI